MSELNLPAIRQGMEQKSTEQLMDILTHLQDDYQPVVIDLIKDIVRQRGVPQSDIEEANVKFIHVTVSKKRTKFQPKRSLFVRVVSFIVGLLAMAFVKKLFNDYQKNNLIPQIIQQDSVGRK